MSPAMQHHTMEIEIVRDPAGEPTRATGRVRWFSREKGYGFVEPEDGGEDVFVRFSSIAGEGFRSLEAGQRVSYVLGDDGRGPRADDVRPA